MNNSGLTETISVPSTAELFAFPPSAQRARFLSQRMRSSMGESLRYIAEQADGQLEFDPKGFHTFLAQLESRPISPQAFCLYHDVVIATENDDVEKAALLFNELLQLPAHPGGPTIIELPDPQKDQAGQRYARFVETEATANFRIFPPSSEAAAGCRDHIQGAFDLMEAGDPDLAGEIRAMIVEIILAAGTEDPKAMTFDGASAFLLWGGILINANRRDGDIGMVQMLAHESAHDLIFALGANEALVENSPDELFQSPLRVDPRPMEGIYHATFVLARMHRAVAQLVQSGILSKTQLEKARDDLAENARLFGKGIETVRRHGKLSSLGEALIYGAGEYMASVS